MRYRYNNSYNNNYDKCPKEDRHVHFIESVTTVDDGHRHNFQAATLIENPTGFDRHDRYGEDSCDCKDRNDRSRRY